MPSGADRVDTVWFSSKVDWWLGALLAGAPIVTIVTLIGVAWTEEEVALPLLAMPVAVMLVVYGLFLFPLRYGVTADELVVRSGVIVQGCRLAEIREVTPTRSPLSAPALSLDRLEIRYGPDDDVVVISPRDKDAFLTLLRERTSLERHGDRLVDTARVQGGG